MRASHSVMSQQLNHRLNKSQLEWLIFEVQLMEIYVDCQNAIFKVVRAI